MAIADPEFNPHSRELPIFAVTVFLVILVVGTGLFVLIRNAETKIQAIQPPLEKVATDLQPSSVSPTPHIPLPDSFNWTKVSGEESILAEKALLVTSSTGVKTEARLEGTEYVTNVSQYVNGIPSFLRIEEFYDEQLAGWVQQLTVSGEIIAPYSLESNIETATGYIRRNGENYEVVILYEKSSTLPGTSASSDSPTQLRIFISDPFTL